MSSKVTGLKKTFTLNDLNNFEGADRKLCINENQEYWVHDEALTQNSGFFKHLFGIYIYIYNVYI